ncbi:MAG: reverse transcriptase family protein [Pirellulales bacterium]
MFDFLSNLWRQLTGGQPVRKPLRHVPGRPGICSYCGNSLRTLDARQCFSCGMDWHNANDVVLRSPDPDEAARLRALAAARLQQGASPPIPLATSAQSSVAQNTNTQRPAVIPPSPEVHTATLAALDGNPFAPPSDDELRRRARGLRNRFGGGWFGRRDLIPPISDERTLLIDQGMVAHGLLTPEQLDEIHKVGLQMDAVRPDLLQAHTVADAAVARSQEERAAIKARKKAEAAESKRLRAEEIARRKQTDVVYLGRGVSKGLADRRSDVEKLAKLNLPVLAAPADVAQALGLSVSRLRWLAFHNEAASRVHYVRFTVPKKSGGVRELSAPHRSLAAAQEWILANVLERIPVHTAAHGFVPARSTLTNAAPHVGREVVVNLDLKDFFPTITFVRVKGIFQQLGYSPAAATVLAPLSTESPRREARYDGEQLWLATGPRALPQGACTSPALSNLAARRFDARLQGLAAKLGWTYTRYADDLTFSASGDAATKVGYLLARVRHLAEHEGFVVNEKKTRVQCRNTAQSVTGLVVNERVAPPRKLIRRLRAILHRARMQGLASQNRENRPNFQAWLRGMIAYVEMANAEQGRKLRAEYEALLPGK